MLLKEKADIISNEVSSNTDVLGQKTIIISDSKLPGKQKIVFVLPVCKYKIKG